MFALLGGDLTDNGSNLVEWEEFLDAATSVFSDSGNAGKGNHDKGCLSSFALPDNGPRESGSFYSFDYGEAHFVVLDTGNVITEG